MCVSSVIASLIKLLGPSAVLCQESDMLAHTEDWRGRYAGPALCVALPSTAQEVAAVVACCAHEGVPVLPQGGNTSLCGGAVPGKKGPAPVIVNLARMRRIRNVDPDNNTIEVEAGCVLAAIHQAAEAHKRFYPISLGSEGSCQIGGNISTNAGGTGVLCYGNTRDNVLGLEVVLADGSMWNGLRTLRKDNTGLDVKQLFIGTEGTMGIITAATLKLHPMPRAHAFAWVAVQSPHEALQLLNRCKAEFGSHLSAFEMLNAEQVDLVVRHIPNKRCPLEGRHDWHVLIELTSDRADAQCNQAMQRVLEQALDAGLLLDAALATSEAQRRDMWDVRHSVSEANKKAGIGLTSDTAVPVSSVPVFIERATDAVKKIDPSIGIVVVAHLGDGNVHFIPFFSFPQWDALEDSAETSERVRRAVNDEAYALSGTFSAEHGVGQAYTAQMAQYKSSVELAIMRAAKQALDPRNTLNPGRLLP